MKKIKEFRFGDKATLVLRVGDLQLRKTASNADYASFLGYDGTDVIEVKIWSLSPEQKSNLINGEIYVFDGTIKDYQGKMQLNVNNFRIITEADNIDTKSYYEYAPMDETQLQENVLAYIGKIKNQNLRQIVINLLKKHYSDFFTHPAAVTIHHNYFCGLSYHTYSMLKLSDRFLELYPFLNSDLVYAGIILHDIGKTQELSGAKGTEYTLEGNLLGHISIGANLIYHEACLLQIEKTKEVTQLLHVILAHHGQLEYGSPKTPLMAEALAIHLIDLSDSRMEALRKEVTQTNKGEFTNPLNAFERKMFFVSDIED